MIEFDWYKIVAVFFIQILFSFFYTAQINAVANNLRLRSLGTVSGLNIVWMIGTSIGLSALADGDYPTCVSYLIGTAIGNDINFYLKRRKNDK